MSTSPILPAPAIDYAASSATPPQQTVFNNLLQQLEQAIDGGDLTTSQTLFNALTALSPSASSASNPLGVFLTSLNTALNDGSPTEAQSALSTYLSTNPSTTTPAATSSADTSATASTIANNLVLSQIQLNLVTSLLGPGGADNLSSSNSSDSSSNSTNALISLLNAAYPPAGAASTSGSAGSPAATAASAGTPAPYDTLVSSIQSSLAAGNGTITPALAYLQASGNFVNTSV
jgi:hypothetical protein